jgi:aminoglycoside phosphotransferase (APT) family kinase protein
MGVRIRSLKALAGGYSHHTVLVDTDGAGLVMRFGGPRPDIEAAVMRRAADVVPVPPVRFVNDDCLVIDHVPGMLLSEAMCSGLDPAGLGRTISESLCRVGTIGFERPGFFSDERLTVTPQPSWSRLLPEVVADCMTRQDRLDHDETVAWLALCERAASRLPAVDGMARLVHADANPKNVLVRHTRQGWRVAAWLDWEFAHSGCPYADAANMLRFGQDYPPEFIAGFCNGYSADRSDCLELGQAFDLFSLSQLLLRPVGHPIGDRVEELVRQRLRS